MAVIEFVISTVVLLAAGGYLEHKFGSKVASRVSSVEARVTAVESAVSSKGAALVAAAADVKKAL